MEQLIKMLEERVGLPEDKARLALDTVLEHLRKVLPTSMAGALDAYLAQSGEAHETPAEAGIASTLGGLFGGSH